MGKAEPIRKSTKRRWPRRVAVAAAVLALGAGGAWYGVNHTAWMGPMLADGLRAVLGPRFVAWAEDTAYSLQDRVNRWRYKDEKPKTFWEAPTAVAIPTEAPAASAGTTSRTSPTDAIRCGSSNAAPIVTTVWVG